VSARPSLRVSIILFKTRLEKRHARARLAAEGTHPGRALTRHAQHRQTTGARQVWKPGYRAAGPPGLFRAGAARQRVVFTS
jgi:hypothetical protein